MSARRAPLTRKVRRGLGSIRPLVSVNLDNGEGGEFQHLNDEQLAEVQAAMDWIDDNSDDEPAPAKRKK